MTTTSPIVTMAASALVAVALTACASTAPKELKEARSTIQQSETGLASQQAPAELHEAKEALKRAELWFEDEGDEPVTRDWAYIATRRAQIADTIAQIRVQEQRIVQADQELESLAGEIRRTTSRELEEIREELVQQRQETQTQRQARLQAEQRAQQALQALEQYVEVQEEQRGVVITLSSGPMFPSGSSAMQPAAEQNLRRVADYLRANPDRSITIEGHTDSVGSAQLNQRLSRERATTVRNFLVDQGISSERMEVKAYGEERPVADNATASGRAANRRVEIVVESREPSVPTQQSPGQGPATDDEGEDF